MQRYMVEYTSPGYANSVLSYVESLEKKTRENASRNLGTDIQTPQESFERIPGQAAKRQEDSLREKQEKLKLIKVQATKPNLSFN